MTTENMNIIDRRDSDELPRKSDAAMAAHNEHIASQAAESHSRLLQLLVEIANPMNDSEEVLKLFRERCTETRLHFALVLSFVERSEKPDIARGVFQSFYQSVSLDSLASKDILRAFAAAVLCGDSAVAHTSFSLYISTLPEQLSEPKILLSLIGYFHKLAKRNKTEVVHNAWLQLHDRWPNNMSLMRIHRNFLETYPDQESVDYLNRLAFEATTCDSKERRKLLSEIAKSPTSRFLLLECCDADLMASPDRTMQDYWINTADYIANILQDTKTANRLWAKILDFAPERVRAFLTFSRKYNRMKADAETDALIKRAHSLVHSTPKVSTAKSNDSILIGEESHVATEWLRLMTGKMLQSTDDCAPIALALFRYDNRFSQDLITLLQKTAVDSPQYFLTIIRSLALDQLFLNCILHAVILGLAENSIVDEALEVLSKASPRGSSIRILMTTLHIKRGQLDNISDIWSGISTESAPACAHFAMRMLRLRKVTIAKDLFCEVARVSPEECIRFGYQFFCQPRARDIVLHCIEPLLPTGSEQEAIQRHSLLALRLLHRHGGQERAREILARLENSNLITPEDAEKIVSAQMTLAQGVGVGDQDEDRDIIDFLQQHMPTLQRPTFFSAMMSGEASPRGGTRTNASAVSVVILPERGTGSLD